MSNTARNWGKESAKNAKSVKPKTKKKISKVREEFKFDIDLENMEPWSPTTDAWESDEEKTEDLLGNFGMEDGEASSTVSTSTSEDNSDWEDDDVDEGKKKAISGSYMFRYEGDESEDDGDDDPEDNYQYRIPELNLIAFKVKPNQVVNPEGRLFMKYLIMREREREKQRYLVPRGKNLPIPKKTTNFVATADKRRRSGPFLSYSVPYPMPYMFEGLRLKPSTKLGAGFFEIPTFRRPPFRVIKHRYPRFGRMRTIPVALDCKHCFRHSFVHHRNPDMHYEDYINLIQLQGANPEADPKPFRKSITELRKAWKKIANNENEKKPKSKGKKPVIADPPPTRPRRRLAPDLSRLLNDTVATSNKKKDIVYPPGETSAPFNATRFNLYSKYSNPTLYDDIGRRYKTPPRPVSVPSASAPMTKSSYIPTTRTEQIPTTSASMKQTWNTPSTLSGPIPSTTPALLKKSFKNPTTRSKPIPSTSSSLFKKKSSGSIPKPRTKPTPSTSSTLFKKNSNPPKTRPGTSTPKSGTKPRTSSSSLPTPQPGPSTSLTPRPQTPCQFFRPNSTLYNDTIASSRKKRATPKKRTPPRRR